MKKSPVKIMLFLVANQVSSTLLGVEEKDILMSS
jgi:hypothetical protein